MEMVDALLGSFNTVCNLHVMSLLKDPIDLVRAAAVSHHWRRFVIENGLCKRLFLERFPCVTHIAYEVNGRYQIIRFSDVLSGDTADWGAVERDHRIYSYLLQPRSKRMDCPRDCILFPVGVSSAHSIAENIITATIPVATYPVGYSFLSSEGQSEARIDFLQCLDTDVVVHILSFLNDPADMVHVGAVSRFWRQFVIAQGLAKQMCLKVFPQLSSIAGVVIGSTGTTSSDEAKTSTAMKSEFSDRDHTVYASLLHAVKNSKVSQDNCVLNGISASTTDNFPAKSIGNTLYPKHTFMGYWSSKGQSNPEVPETLLYKLKTLFSVITEIDIQPFEAYCQHRKPIYSAKSVRFRMGHPKSQKEMNSELQHLPVEKCFDDKFVWTYTSPEFPMKQESELQRFKLPEPALCVGGYVQIELLGRVQRHEKDRLFYICVDNVQVVGRTLTPAFDTPLLEPSGEIWLRYDPQFLEGIMNNSCVDERSRLARLQGLMLWERMGFTHM